MNPVLFPGLGNPDSCLYADVFAVIEREALGRGFNKVFRHVRWPGHATESDYAASPPVNLPGAVAAARKAISVLPREPFVILGRSFGCQVALALAASGSTLAGPVRMILWGPPPYWLYWENFVRRIDSMRTSARGKGANIDESLHATLVPFESLLIATNLPVSVTTGTGDIFCTPSYLEYLRSISLSNEKVCVKSPVHVVPHEVTDACGKGVVSRYAKTLFG